METIKITKKALKEKSTFIVYGKGINRIVAMFFDWKTGTYTEDGIEKYFGGYRYMVAGKGYSRKELIEDLQIWLKNGYPYQKTYQDTRYAEADKNRFKIPLSYTR